LAADVVLVTPVVLGAAVALDETVSIVVLLYVVELDEAFDTVTVAWVTEVLLLEKTVDESNAELDNVPVIH